MDVRNRMADVVKLRCNACQEFMKYVLKESWQEELYEIARDAVEKKRHADNYISAFEKMRTIGKNNYSVEDMDVSFITTIVQYCRSLVSVNNNTVKALVALKNDRNDTSHSDENEEPEELYLRALLSLCDLRIFIRTVDREEINSIDDEDRMKYRQKYLGLIDDLQDLLDEERIELIQKKKARKKDIQCILDSEDPKGTWIKLLEMYHKKDSLYRNDMNECITFIVEAAEAGVEEAYESVADYYYLNKEYDLAEKYLRMLYIKGDDNILDVKDMMQLADIYINKRCAREGDGVSIINRLIAMGTNIKKSSDGTSYEWISKSEALKGKSLFSIQIPQ